MRQLNQKRSNFNQVDENDAAYKIESFSTESAVCFEKQSLLNKPIGVPKFLTLS